jgi:hypothetical protein
MGQWVVVDLAYGFDLGHGIPDFLKVNPDNDNDGDVLNYWQEWCAFQKGVMQPPLKPFKNEKAWQEYNDAASEFQREYPFEILTYHSYSGPFARYFLALSETVQSGGREKPMDANVYGVDPKIFKDFCEIYKIPYSEPKWQIVSLYG